MTGVFHLAASLDDGIVPALTGERLERVLRPKVDGAVPSARADGGSGSGRVRAVLVGGGTWRVRVRRTTRRPNVFLDALAAERRHRGLAAQSLAWGFWEPRGAGMTAHLGKAELMRMRRQGVLPLTPELGLKLLDAALSRPEVALIPLHLDLGVLQRQLGGGGRAGAVPWLAAKQPEACIGIERRHERVACAACGAGGRGGAGCTALVGAWRGRTLRRC